MINGGEEGLERNLYLYTLPKKAIIKAPVESEVTDRHQTCSQQDPGAKLEKYVMLPKAASGFLAESTHLGIDDSGFAF